MAHPQKKPEPAWVQLLAPPTPNRRQLWILSLLLTAWVAFLLTMYFLTVARHAADGRATPATPIVALASPAR